MKIIDIHTHIYPDKIARKATESVRDFYQIYGGNLEGTVDELLAQGEKAGISQYVVLPVSNTPSHVRSINTFILNQTAQHDNFIGFGTLHAEMDGLMDEVDWILQNGFHGIKMHPDSQQFAIDDPRLFPVYEAVQGKLSLMIHLGDERYNYSHPARLRKVLKEFPNLQVCAAHFGGHTMYEEAKENLSDTSCILDISSTLMFLDKKTAEGYVNHYGAERLAFGTDYPVWDPKQEVERFLSLDLTDQQKEQIAWKTAARFLNL